MSCTNICRWCYCCPSLKDVTATHYKLAAKILSSVVLVSQICRISIIGYEIKNVNHAFAKPVSTYVEDICDYKSSYTSHPRATAILFCIISIIMGLISLALEGLLFWAIKKRHLPGIQPWFVVTLLIYLIAIISCVVTFSIYVINPLDNNFKLNCSSPTSQVINSNYWWVDTSSSMVPPTEVPDLQFAVSETTNVTLRVIEKNGIVSCLEIGAISGVVNTSQELKIRYVEATGGQHLNFTSCGEYIKSRKPIYYYSNPVLSMTFFLDIFRCIPQMFLVNRFVKAEKLHSVHMTSEPSFSTLYVKHI